MNVIDVASKVSSISEIIVVDDGSTNRFGITTDKYANVVLIKHARNQGKSSAIKTGLERAKNENILLLDADLSGLDACFLEKALHLYSNSGLDLLLLRVTGGNNWFDRLLRKEILLAGSRVIKRAVLIEVYKTKFEGFQLEVATNEYMMRNNKKVAWIPTEVINVHKSKKWGLLKGYLWSIKMELSIIAYLGLIRFIKQVLLFARKQVVIT